MILYFFYRIGYFIANWFPLRATYAIACLIADIYYFAAHSDRKAVTENLKVIIGDDPISGKALRRMTREVFRNFAKYLTDFFRFAQIDDRYINKFVKYEGLDNIDKARSRGRGVIILSAHLGNWELGGFVLSHAKGPLSAVVLTHKNKRIDDFFTRQRTLAKMKPVTLGMSLRGCYDILNGNGLLALLGDRNFSAKGMHADFFGRRAFMPKGPAVLSTRLNATVVPCFLIREKNDFFRFIAEEPIYPEPALGEDSAVRKILNEYLHVIEMYVKKYPTQWYVFKEVWSEKRENLQPDTVI